jgi:hypothetical protein
MWQNIYQFCETVWLHLVTILAGCGATVVLDQFRRFAVRKKWIVGDWPDGWWLVMILVFGAFASFQSWEDQYTSNKGRTQDLHAQELKTIEARTDRDSEQRARETCEYQRDFLRTELTRQAGNFSGQQQTLNTCVVALAKNNAPVPLIIATTLSLAPLKITLRNRASRLIAVIATANKSVSPVNIILHCETPYHGMRYEIADNEITPYMVSSPVVKEIDSMSTKIGFTSPPWNLGTQLIMWIGIDDDNNLNPTIGKCDVKPQ